LPLLTPSYLPENGGDFESNYLHFASKILSGNLNIWELGAPSNTINNTASGTNVWKTDLDSNITMDNYISALYTPAFDLLTVGGYAIKFNYRMEYVYFNAPAAAWMEYSLDLGETWQRLGSDTGNPDGTQNWYNRNNSSVAPDGICWWHTRSTYTESIYNLDSFLGASSICFRWIFKVTSNWDSSAFNCDGFAVDDFSLVYVSPSADFTTENDSYYTGKPIQFIDQSLYPTNWNWNLGDNTSSSSQNITHTYSEPGEYTVTLSINNSLFTTSKRIVVLPTIKPSYTLVDGGNFESNTAHFSTYITSGSINLWEWGTPSNVIADTASGLSVWKTDLDANITKDDYTCVLNTPNFILSRSGEYYVKFKYRLDRYYDNSPGAAWMEYSTDKGENWQRLGAFTGNPTGTQNWYDKDEQDVAPDNFCWWYSKSSYTQAIYNLSTFAGTSNLAFRFVFKVEGHWSSAGYDIDGWAIDDFELEHITNAPTIHTEIPDQTVDQGSSFTSITLDNYVTDTNHSYTEITWTVSGCSQLSITIDNSRIVTITAIDNNWSGSESITFTATDPDGMTDTDAVSFTVLSVNSNLTISTLLNQNAINGFSTSITFQITDTEGGYISISATSSDLSLVSSENICFTGTAISQTGQN